MKWISSIARGMRTAPGDTLGVCVCEGDTTPGQDGENLGIFK